MRHAKAESHGETDHSRPLAPSGRRDAAAAGAWLAQEGIEPDAVLVSSAARTTATWEEVSLGVPQGVSVESSSALYAAEPESALDLVRGTAAEVGTLLVIGHNPTIGTAAQLLDDGEGDTDAAVAMIGGFPTAAMAVFDVPVAWADVAPGGLRLRSFHVARAD